MSWFSSAIKFVGDAAVTAINTVPEATLGIKVLPDSLYSSQTAANNAHKIIGIESNIANTIVRSSANTPVNTPVKNSTLGIPSTNVEPITNTNYIFNKNWLIIGILIFIAIFTFKD